jgi:crotonobetainyl-CoA:carnitine CoA-transferase CaiB-like acyl-CoA transferase
MTGDSTSPPLAGLRVLECGGDLAAAYAGRLLAGLGADVVTVEPPSGGGLRRRGPFLDEGAEPCSSATAAYLNAGKRSVCLDASSEDGRARLAALAGAADVVVRGDLGGGGVHPTDELLAEARGSNPGLVAVDISSFGRTGPLAGEPGGDLITLAASGMLSIMSTAPTEDDPSPLRYPGEVSSLYAACDAVIAALGALHARLADGAGQDIDVSAQEAVVSIMATAPAAVSYSGTVPVHDGSRGVCPWAIYPCVDGAVLVQCTEDGQWRALLDVLGNPEWGDLEMFETTAGRVEQAEAVEPLVASSIAGWEMDAFLAAAHAAGVPAARVHTPQDVLAWEQLTSRSFFTELEVGQGGAPRSLRAPSSPVRLDGVHRPTTVRAPGLGEHTDEVAAAWNPRPAADTLPGSGAEPAAPLAGVRVIDMTWVWAGPASTMQLAHLGADVIKVESSERIDVTRRLGPFADEVPGLNRSGYFNQYNQGKKSVCLNLSEPAGRALLERLIASADVIVDNMRAGALARMGFPYEHLRTLNPAIVAVSMTGFGEDGPERDRLAYGSIIDALSGVVSMTGPAGGEATDVPMSLPDPCAGKHAAIGTLAALHRARTTGVGARVECSMIEAWIAAMPWGLLAVEAEGRAPRPRGNRDELMSPHGVFRCAGAYEWVAVAVEDDDRFAALAAAIGRPDLGDDPRFATLAARQANEDELEALLGAWTADRDAAAVACALRAAGVSARRVERMDDVLGSEHLAARGFLTRLDHPEVGVRPLAGVSWRASRSPMCATTAAPMLGQHTEEVMREVLGLSPDELAELAGAGLLA